MSVFCSAEYRRVVCLEENFPASENGHLVWVSSARLITSVRITRHGPATISQVPKSFGGYFQWKILTAFAFAVTHPITPVRFVQMQRVAAEIADKQRRNLPLNPELTYIQADTEASPAAGESVH